MFFSLNPQLPVQTRRIQESDYEKNTEDKTISSKRKKKCLIMFGLHLIQKNVLNWILNCQKGVQSVVLHPGRC